LTIQNENLNLTDLEMEEEAGIKEVINGHEDKNNKEEIFTKVVRAGKRTYFFDVKATRKDDYYLTITESKKRLGKEGKVFYEKHKIFLYKEDFDKFIEGLKDYIKIFTSQNAKPVITLNSLKKLQQNLPPKRFSRIHKSYIVGLDHIKAINKTQVLINDRYIPIGDSYKDIFMNRLSEMKI